MSEIKNVKKRDIRLDILKGIAILFVVIGHVINYKYDPENYNQNILFRIAYSFHMPLFFFVSGYLTGFKKPDSFTVDFIQKKTVRLLIPYFLWSFVFDLNQFLLHGFVGGILGILNVMFANPLYWFLPCLWFCFLLLVPCVKAKHPVLIAFAAFFVSFVIWILTKNFTKLFSNTIWYFPFFFAAYYVSANKEKFNVKWVRCVLWASLILYPLSMLFFSYPIGKYEVSVALPAFFESGMGAKGVQGILIVYNKYFVPALGICFFWQLTKLVTNFSLRKWNKPGILLRVLACIGVYSLQIYIFHGLMFNIRYSENLLVLSLITVIASVTCSVIIGFIVKKSKRASFICFGE